MRHHILRLVPGIALSAAVTGTAVLLARAETALFGRAWLESLVLAILLGTLVRTLATVPVSCEAGVRFSAKVVLELAVMLLGASVSAGAVAAHGLPLLGGIALAVVLAIMFSYAVGRLLRLPHEMAVLVACGNSICGNSAIAAVAPVIAAICF